MRINGRVRINKLIGSYQNEDEQKYEHKRYDFLRLYFVKSKYINVCTSRRRKNQQMTHA